MIDRFFLAVVGFIAFWIVSPAPQARAAEVFNLGGVTSDRTFPFPESLSLENRQTFFFSTSFGWMQPTKDFLPTFNPLPQHRNVAFAKEGRTNSIESVELRSPSRIYFGGEIGFLYGRSSGKYGVEYEQGYVIGELGNDWFHLRVGASYDRTRWRGPR